MTLVTYDFPNSVQETICSFKFGMPPKIVLYNNTVTKSKDEFEQDVPKDMLTDECYTEPSMDPYKYLFNENSFDFKGFIFDKKYVFVRTTLEKLFPVLLHEIGHFKTDDAYEGWDPEIIKKQEIFAHEWALDKIFRLDKAEWFESYISILKQISLKEGTTQEAANTTLQYFSTFDYSALRHHFLKVSKFKFKTQKLTI